MDPADQVATHEAMEQQTISITKAGIQATLNARTAILAAANPVFGRYDRTKTLKANVTISAPIISRFDLFFVNLDECNPKTDEANTGHIINNHVIQKVGVDDLDSLHAGNAINYHSSNKIFMSDQLRRYIKFAKSLNPVLTEEAAAVLVEKYRLLRGNDLLGKNRTAYRITVRQLESVVRLSEALARLHLDPYVQPMYVKVAYRLLQKSIIFVETENVELADNEEEMNQIYTENNKENNNDIADHFDNDDGISGRYNDSNSNQSRASEGDNAGDDQMNNNNSNNTGGNMHTDDGTTAGENTSSDVKAEKAE
jgi:DNA replication licensing factor MCM6